MKHNKINALLLAAIFGITLSCKDDSIELIPEWESAVHGLGEVTSANADFLYNSPTTPIEVDLQWISIDGKESVTKMEVFVLFNENYIDKDGNPALARHGGTDGKSFKVYEGAAVPANRTPVHFSLSQAELYNLYSTATFDYGNGTVPVFTNPANPNRDAAHRFMWDDDISIKWVYTSSDGRVFEKWGVSVCTEFPGANCSVDVTVVCASSIANPAGTWVFNLRDNYGDGWQGGYIKVLLGTTEVDQIKIPDGGGASGNDTYTYPPGDTRTLSFSWSADSYPGEVEFDIISPSGNTVASFVGAPPVGPIKLDLCLE
jgi:hypothetical protein